MRGRCAPDTRRQHDTRRSSVRYAPNATDEVRLARLRSMPTQDRRADRAKRVIPDRRVRIGTTSAGCPGHGGSEPARPRDAAGMSHAQLGRIEHGAAIGPSVDQLIPRVAVLGLDLSVRLYPDGQPVRDRRISTCIGTIRRTAADGSRRSVPRLPIPIEGDRRAWDLQILGLRPSGSRSGPPVRRAGVEAETRLSDLQALIRRTSLKARDSGIGTVVLLVSDTRTNRRILREYETRSYARSFRSVAARP